MREAGLTAEQLDYVVFYDKPLTKFERLLDTYLAYSPAGLCSFSLAMPLWLKEKLYTRRKIQRSVGIRPQTPVLFTDHHESHAASAFFPSPYEKAAILTLDGVGERSTTTDGSGAGNRIGLSHGGSSYTSSRLLPTNEVGPEVSMRLRLITRRGDEGNSKLFSS